MRPRDREGVPLDHLEQRTQRRAGPVGTGREPARRRGEQRGLGWRPVTQMRCQQGNPHLVPCHQRLCRHPLQLSLRPPRLVWSGVVLVVGEQHQVPRMQSGPVQLVVRRTDPAYGLPRHRRVAFQRLAERAVAGLLPSPAFSRARQEYVVDRCGSECSPARRARRTAARAHPSPSASPLQCAPRRTADRPRAGRLRRSRSWPQSPQSGREERPPARGGLFLHTPGSPDATAPDAASRPHRAHRA